MSNRIATTLVTFSFMAATYAVSAQQIQLFYGDEQPNITIPKAGISMDLNAIDKSADPCQDFYAYACGNWRKNNPIPADKSRWGRFDELGEHNRYTVHDLLEQAAKSPKTPLQVKYGNYYAACMNQTLADQLGIKPIQPILARINHWQNKAELASLIGELQSKDGISFFYGFGSQQDQKDSLRQIAVIEQGGLGLPDRDYYLQQDDRSKIIRAKYLTHVTNMFTLAGDTPEQAATEAKAVIAVETALAEGSTPRVELRDPANIYHIMTLAQLEQLAPNYKWATYFNSVHEPINTLNVSTPNYFKTLNAQIESTSIADLKSYMRWHVLHSTAGSLSSAFDDENFDFFARTLAGQKQQSLRWERCTVATDSAMGEAVGQDWVNANFPAAAKQNMEQLVHAMETALGQDISSLDWMSAATKAEAQKKLIAFRDKIGYPEVWRDYATLEIKRDDRVGNGLRVIKLTAVAVWTK